MNYNFDIQVHFIRHHNSDPRPENESVIVISLQGYDGYIHMFSLIKYSIIYYTIVIFITCISLINLLKSYECS